MSKNHILTAAHCCHSGGHGGGWFSNFRWYPGALSPSDLSPNNEHSLIYASILGGWLWWEKNWNYDICWLTLHHPYTGWMGFGYNNGITSSWKFNMWGYPGDKQTRSQIKWGHDDWQPDTVWINQFHFFCDATKGMSGSGLWPSSNNKVYCVFSYETTGILQKNACARITPDKFKTMVDSMKSQGGWSWSESLDFTVFIGIVLILRYHSFDHEMINESVVWVLIVVSKQELPLRDLFRRNSVAKSTFIKPKLILVTRFWNTVCVLIRLITTSSSWAYCFSIALPQFEGNGFSIYECDGVFFVLIGSNLYFSEFIMAPFWLNIVAISLFNPPESSQYADEPMISMCCGCFW